MLKFFVYLNLCDNLKFASILPHLHVLKRNLYEIISSYHYIISLNFILTYYIIKRFIISTDISCIVAW